jgi:hypothetical protein|tara:strand:- start:64 stop:783 length:720 start_codon:yes stop_codon:yes gene_type:complete
MVGVTGSILMGAIVYGKELYNFLKPRRVGIYGPTMVGKTTLDRFMTTPGEMEDIEERTDHDPRLIGGGHVLPKATRKRVRWHGEKRIVHSADVGGQQRFWNLWIEDMVERQVEIVVFMVDHRGKTGANADIIDAVGGLEFLVDALIARDWKYRSLKTWWKGRKYAPTQIWVIANKADLWWDDKANILWQSKRLREHPIFDPYRPSMVKLQKAGIPCRVSMMATKIGWNVEQSMLEMLSW